MCRGMLCRTCDVMQVTVCRQDKRNAHARPADAAASLHFPVTVMLHSWWKASSPIRFRHCYGTRSDPLRILFCGSDEFSCVSLSALHREHVRNRGLVEALDVMVLPAKPTGRGLRRLREGEDRNCSESSVSCQAASANIVST